MSLSLKTIIEGLLFVSSEPLTLEKIASVLEGASKERIQKVLDELEVEYEEMGRAFALTPVAGGYQFRTPAGIVILHIAA